MSATIKSNALTDAGADRVAVVVSSRRARERGPTAALELAASLGRHVVVRGQGRRSGACERLVTELLDSGVSTVVVPALTAFHPTSAAKALAICGTLLMARVRVLSLADGWVASAEPETVSAVATYLQAQEQRRASTRGREVIAFVKRTSKAVGRPSKPLPVSVEVAQQLVAEHGWRGAARKTGASTASIRRALARAGLLPVVPARRTA